MRNILLQLAFVGTNYSGWQRQTNGLAVQEVIENALAEITGEKIALTGCSRTDAGVHAEQFFANFRTNASLPADRFRLALQSKLPHDIMVTKSRQVAAGFNARRAALEKSYRYQIYFGKSPFLVDRWWLCPQVIDFRVLPKLTEMLPGDHDFSGFCVRKSLKHSNHCLIKQATWRKDGRKLYFQITGNRFLHRMIRFLVGAQIEVAAGKMSKTEWENIILNQSESRAKYPAPPDGLYLTRVKYS
ncbi:MAG: tRNA pseudouridine(38-40) synthase TruA [candidate division Zixibacteria bacterium]|nr:tRNA pseudouridine(38-40) synthase TruA [candidate division Zixibacteria bacterium]